MSALAHQVAQALLMVKYTAYHLIHLCTVVLLNVSQNSDIITLHKVDGNTLHIKPKYSQQWVYTVGCLHP